MTIVIITSAFAILHILILETFLTHIAHLSQIPNIAFSPFFASPIYLCLQFLFLSWRYSFFVYILFFFNHLLFFAISYFWRLASCFLLPCFYVYEICLGRAFGWTNCFFDKAKYPVEKLARILIWDWIYITSPFLFLVGSSYRICISVRRPLAIDAAERGILNYTRRMGVAAYWYDLNYINQNPKTFFSEKNR